MIILPVVLYGCKPGFLTLRKESRPMDLENKVLRRILGPSRDEVTGNWRRLLSEELYDLYCSSNFVRSKKSRKMKLVGCVARIGDRRGEYRVLVGRPEGKRRIWSFHRLEGNIKIYLQEEGWGHGLD
jgi:hypothetical protein